MFGLCRLYLDCTIAGFGTGQKKLCHKELCQLLLDYADCNWIVRFVFGLYDCNWIVRSYLDCTIVFGLYDCIWIVLLYLDYIIAGFVLPIPHLAPKSCAKNNCVDCSWNMSIVFGLCQLYLDCTIVFGFYDCIWIVSIVFGLCQLYLDCVDCIWIVQLPDLVQLGVVLPIHPPLVTKKLCQKGFCRLHLDCFVCIWIV